MPTDRRRRLIAALAVAGTFGASAFLLLWRLDVPLLWQDEAETANVAESILLRGYPGPWDGEHAVSQQGGRDTVWVGGRLLWAWHPWPQHYLAAAGLGLLGQSTAAARLPFALVALLSVPLFLAWRLRRDRFGTALVATAIYALAPAFVLYSRQSRYYALLFLGGVLALWAYEALTGGRREEGAGSPGRCRQRLGAEAGLALSLALLFYGNPLSGLAFAAGLALHGALRWRRGEAALAPLLRALALFALLAAPWLALVALSDVRAPALGLGARLGLLASQLWRLQYTLLPAVLWPALAWLWWRARRRPAWGRAGHPPRGAQGGALRRATGPPYRLTEAEGRLARTPAGEIELLAVLAAVNWLAVAVQGPMGTARYALALWPLAAAALAALWRALRERSAAAAAAFLGLLLLTDAFQALPALPLAAARWSDPATRWYDREAPALDKLAYHGRILAPLPLHLARLARRECGPVAAVVAVARSLERAPRLVVASYGGESFHFYLGAPAAGPGNLAARERLGLPPLDLSEADLVVPRRGWPAVPGLDPAADPAFVLLDTGVPDHAYENLPDPTGYRFTDTPPDALSTLRLWVRRELLPTEGFGTLQAPGCRPLPRPPGATREAAPGGVNSPG
ncbi:MAG TPA: hypothetical protein VLF66_05825 [Thermoanaerobaculia bacterium]|nr:hypothetical protein [Thermoanaerobaculia bacterium]